MGSLNNSRDYIRDYLLAGVINFTSGSLNGTEDACKVMVLIREGLVEECLL